MRKLGFALLVLSLAFSTGGVAVVGQADTKSKPSENVSRETPPNSGTPFPSVRPAKPLPQQCGVPSASATRVTPQPKRYRSANAQKMALPKDAVPLNTRGYNYGGVEIPQAPPEAKSAPASPAKP